MICKNLICCKEDVAQTTEELDTLVYTLHCTLKTTQWRSWTFWATFFLLPHFAAFLYRIILFLKDNKHIWQQVAWSFYRFLLAYSWGLPPLWSQTEL